MEGYDGNGGWREWSQYVKIGITELKQKTEEISKELNEMKSRLAVLQFKMSMWGFLGGTIAGTVINLIVALAFKKIGGGP